eukprot:5637442-Amphidinium_carterae.1
MSKGWKAFGPMIWFGKTTNSRAHHSHQGQQWNRLLHKESNKNDDRSTMGRDGLREHPDPTD